MNNIRLFGGRLGLSAASVALLCALAGWQMPPQLELRVPFDPTAYPSGGRTLLTYELYLTNFSGTAIDLRRIEVLDADQSAAKPLATFEGEQIDAMLQEAGGQSPAGKSSPRVLNAGATAVVFMQVALDSKSRVPGRLRHRIVTADDSVEGAIAGTHRTKLKVLVPPVRGTDWHASDGPSNDRDNHHRRGLLVLDGRPSISRRYAIDWFLTNGKIYKWREGDAHEKSSYFSYGQPVFAVGGGTIVLARDGMPDNFPGPVEDFRVAGPLTLETATGNIVVLDLGDGQYAHYCHLQPGSLRVKTGDHVRSGEILAHIGVSGDPNVPHLHFEVTTSARPLVGEGVPYLIDRFRVKSPDGAWTTITRELPSRNMLVAFGPVAGNAK
jgi:hypothetical protein